MTMGSPRTSTPAAWIVAPPGGTSFEIWGITPGERLRRCLERAGCTAIRELPEAPELDVSPHDRSVLARSDWIYDERLLPALAESSNTALVAPGSGEPVAACVEPELWAPTLQALTGESDSLPAGLRCVSPEQLAPAYTAKLRKSEPPFLFPARPELAAEIRARTFQASYKGSTDLVTKWVWPLPARAVTQHLAAAQVHPNTVTIASWVLAIAAFWLFWRGWFGVGLLAAWLMTFLDTVDGKLARVTLTSSRLGDVLDHGLDLIHPPFWWFAWGVGLGWATAPATLVVVGGYFVGRALEGIFLAVFGLETHSWRPLDSTFRTVTARRNPNLILFSVGTLAGRPDLGMVMVAIWTLASLAFHAVRLAQALLTRRRGERIEPWDEALATRLRPIEENRGDGRETP